MSTYKTKYLKKIKKINNTLWLDKLINQLEKKSKRVWLWINLEINTSKMNLILSMPFMIVFVVANYRVILESL